MKTTPLKYLVSCNDDVLGEKTASNYCFDYIEIGSVEYGKGITSIEEMTFDKAPSRARRVLHVGDVIISTLRTYLKAVAYIEHETSHPQIASTGFAVLRPRNINGKFLYYSVLSDDFIQQIEANSVGISYPAITATKLMSFKIPRLSLAEQQSIATYLDDRCSKIDTIIAEAKASIEEYKELKQAVIYEAVTKGLDKNEKFISCNVNGLKEIPASWRIVPLKYLCTMQAGKNLVSEQIAETGTYPVYGGNGLRGYYESYNLEGHRILIGRQGALCGNVHEVDGKYWCTEHALVTTVTRIIEVHYLYYLLTAMHLNQYASNAAAQPGLAAANILNLRTVLPSLNIQKEILNYLDKTIPIIDSLIIEKQSLIEDLESYKKSMIYEVVTGKRKVVE